MKKKIEKAIKKRALSLVLCTAMLLGMLPVSALAGESLPEQGESLPALMIEPMPELETRTSKSYYVLGKNSSASGGDGSSAEKPITWTLLSSVENGATIYVMQDSITLNNKQRADKFKTLFNSNNITIKPYVNSANPSDLNNLSSSLLDFTYYNEAYTIKGVTFDGTGYGATYNFDMISVGEGDLTLEDCIVQNHSNNDYGAAIDIFSYGTVSLKNTKVINNKSGLAGGGGSGSAGGITVSGKLNVDATSEVIGNTIYGVDGKKLDILINGYGDYYGTKGGTVKLHGGAKVGDIAFSWIPDNDPVNFTSELKNTINFCSFPFTGNNSKGKLNLGNIIAVGSDGHALTDTDIAKMTVSYNTASNANVYVAKDKQNKAFVQEDFEVVVSPVHANGTFTFTSDPASSIDATKFAPRGSKVTIVAVPTGTANYTAGSFKVCDNWNGDIGTKVSLQQVVGEDKWTLTMPRENIKISGGFANKISQTVADPDHEVSGGGFTYVLAAGENTNMPLTMTNSTVFAAGDTAPDPLISFALDNPTDIIKLEGNTITPLKIGTTIINATAAETATHQSLKQPITVKVVQPLIVALTAKGYAQTELKFTPSLTDSRVFPYNIIADSTGDSGVLSLRKMGGTELTEIPKANWSWGAEYTQSFTGLTPDTEYELVLQATDNRQKTVEAVLRFHTPRAGSTNTGGIEGTVIGTGTITVRVERGNTVIASVGGLQSGETFKFTNLPDGFYNLVATNGTYTVTRMVEVKDGKTTMVEVINVGATQSTVKVESGAPPTAVDKLDDLFAEDIYTGNSDAGGVVAGGGTVEIRLTAAETDSMGADKTPVNAVTAKAAAANKTVGLLLNLTVDMIITPSGALSQTISIPDTGALVAVAVPLPAGIRGKSGYQVLRYHGDKVDALKEILPSTVPTVESFFIEGGYAHIYAQKFSTYAIAYNYESGGDGIRYYTLSYEVGGGTAVSPSIHSSGTVVKLDKTPTREGYIFEGWYADKAMTERITEIKMNSDKTVYARWNEEKKPMLLNTTDHYAYVLGRSDGLIHPAANITRAETATLFFRLLTDGARQDNLTVSNAFGDVESDDWFNAAVSTLAKMGIVNGKGNGSFDPDAYITRAEFAAIAARFSTGEYIGEDLFTDISGSWARDEINDAASYGWVQGDGDGTFRPNDAISRAEAIAIINRVLGRLPKSRGDLLDSMTVWADNMNEGAWYYLPIQEATNSHDYDRHIDGIHERWTKIIEASDGK